MLHHLNEIRGYDIAATDGSLGRAADFYFDDRTWRVRYLVVSTGWLFGRDVLIAPEAIRRSISRRRREISLLLTREQIEASPAVATDLPVSKQQETAMRSHYGWPSFDDVYPVAAEVMAPRPFRDEETRPDEESAKREDAADPHLRSAREVAGYRIEAVDGEIGHVADFVIDEETWLIRFLIVDTSNWLPGRKVVLPLDRARGVDWRERLVTFDLTREEIRTAPEYDPARPIDEQYESVLHEHHAAGGPEKGEP